MPGNLNRLPCGSTNYSIHIPQQNRSQYQYGLFSDMLHNKQRPNPCEMKKHDTDHYNLR